MDRRCAKDRARSRPSAVSPMNVPPTRIAARKMPISLGQTTLAATPAASTTHASANAAGMPRRVAISVQNATEGAAARPNITQITGSNERIIGVPRTMATRKVAVIT